MVFCCCVTDILEGRVALLARIAWACATGKPMLSWCLCVCCMYREVWEEEAGKVGEVFLQQVTPQMNSGAGVSGRKDQTTTGSRREVRAWGTG